MQEISVFYDENLDDTKIHFFEKLRNRIKKALFNRPGKNQQQMNHLTINNDLFNTAPGQEFFERQALTNQEAEAWDMQARHLSAHKEEDKEFVNIQTSGNKHLYEAEGYSHDRLRTESDAQRSGKPQQSHELVFKVKLNQEEYNMYMREKAIRNQRLGIQTN